jgi:hypothetical protein
VAPFNFELTAQCAAMETFNAFLAFGANSDVRIKISVRIRIKNDYKSFATVTRSQQIRLQIDVKFLILGSLVSTY